MFKFEHLKETIIAVFISSAILGHEMILKLSIPSSIISGSNWENLKLLSFNPIYSYAYKKIVYLYIQFRWQFRTTSSCFRLLISCRGDLILDKKKKKIKTLILWWKRTKTAFFILNSSCWPLMWHAPNFREAEKYWSGIILSREYNLYLKN